MRKRSGAITGNDWGFNDINYFFIQKCEHINEIGEYSKDQMQNHNIMPLRFHVFENLEPFEMILGVDDWDED